MTIDYKIDFWLRHMTVAVREYAAAKATKNTRQMGYWEREFTGITQVLSILETIKDQKENQNGHGRLLY